VGAPVSVITAFLTVAKKHCRQKPARKDVAALLDKYLRAMEWDIPEADEAKARQLNLDKIRQAVSRLEH